MASLAAALITRLLANSAVTDIVGSGSAARVHWVVRPQGESLPALVLTQISSVRDDRLDGEDDIITTRLQCDCLARSHATSGAIAKAVGDLLIQADDTDGILFWEGEREGPLDLGDDTPEGFVHRAVLDVVLRHTA